MEKPRFQAVPENFICRQCGAQVQGTGFTNHCPRCLYSRHVDVHPGDRADRCGNLMRPVSVTVKSGEWEQILHRCVCGHERANKVQENDEEEALFALLENQ